MGISGIWNRIADWLGENAPETAASLRSPVDLAKSAERTAGFPAIPDDAQQLYGLFDGTDRTPAGYIYPRFRALSAGEAISTWLELTGIWAEIARDEELAMRESERDPLRMNLLRMAGEPVSVSENPYDPQHLGSQPAGTPSGSFLAEFIPFAENMSGDFLFVDTRPGPAAGSIRMYWKEGADGGPTLWGSVGELLLDLEQSLTSGGICAGARPLVSQGVLSWGFEGI